MIRSKQIPYYLIVFRFLMAPLMICLTYLEPQQLRYYLVICIVLGLLSDVFDGIVARYTGSSTPTLRRLDSQTDMLFWLSVGWCSWVLHPEIIKDQALAVGLIIIMEILTYILSLLKFGKETCTHAYLSKCWGITLCIAFVSLIGFGHAGVPFFMATTFGLLSHIDVILIVLLLPKWTHDVQSAYHAWRIRKGIPVVRHKWFNG